MRSRQKSGEHSALANTARSFSPLAITARSQTPCWQTQRGFEFIELEIWITTRKRTKLFAKLFCTVIYDGFDLSFMKEKSCEKSRDTASLKGQCHKIFAIFLFHESKPSGPLINRLKWVCREQFCLFRPLLALDEKTKKFKNMCELLQHSPAFFFSFLKG